MSLQHKRSSIAHKRPVATSLNDGQLALNLNATSPGVFFKNSSNVLTKVGPVHVGTDAPNASPATGGSSGNSIGEQWLDTTGGTYVLKIWDGTAWRSESGTFVDVSGDTMTGALILPSGTEAAPALGVGTSDNGLYLPATDELGVSTNGSERLRIASDGDVGIGTTSPDGTLHVHTATAGSVSANASADNLIVENSGAGGISILTPNASAGGLFFGSPGDNIGAALRWNHDNDQFQIGPDKSGAHLRLNSGDGVEAMRIDSSGQVGIGTSSPSTALHVSSTSSSQLTLQRDGSGDQIAGIIFNDGGGDQNRISSGGNSLRFGRGTGNTESMRIDSSGRVLVGISSASSAVGMIVGKSANDSIGRIFIGKNDTTIASGNGIGAIQFGGSADETQGAEIKGEADATWTHSSSHPSRLVFSTTASSESSPTERMRIDSSGQIDFNSNSRIEEDGLFKTANGSATAPSHAFLNDPDNGMFRATTNTLGFSTGGSERLRVDSSGRLLLGTTTEGQASADNFTIADSGHCGITIRSGTTSEGAIYFSDGTSGDAEYRGQVFYDHDGDYMRFSTAASEHMRIDSDGRLLVGETSASGAGRLVVSGNTVNGEDSIVTIDRGSATTSSGQTLGRINFTNGGDDVVHAAILCQTDAACGSNDNPGRILLSTTADGASSPTERMRIKENGDVSCGAAAHLDGFSISSSSATGSRFASSGTAVHFASGTSALVLSRQTNDGIIVSLRQAGSEEGSITVSGSTVSYNGGHLSRWSQLAGGAERTEILRGSVLSNLDEMCEWGEEDNEQLNRMKVSDVEGDRNVSGVFQDWDDDDDTYTNDFYCAMTGDFIIRIAQGTTVARGDLLMSAGDGTAKPQDDDIVRSKTIAKVTSTTVSTTYTDGSYCVPCVLMAC